MTKRGSRAKPLIRSSAVGQYKLNGSQSAVIAFPFMAARICICSFNGKNFRYPPSQYCACPLETLPHRRATYLFHSHADLKFGSFCRYMSSFAKAPTCEGWLNSMPVNDV